MSINFNNFNFNIFYIAIYLLLFLFFFILIFYFYLYSYKDIYIFFSFFRWILRLLKFVILILLSGLLYNSSRKTLNVNEFSSPFLLYILLLNRSAMYLLLFEDKSNILRSAHAAWIHSYPTILDRSSYTPTIQLIP